MVTPVSISPTNPVNEVPDTRMICHDPSLYCKIAGATAPLLYTYSRKLYVVEEPVGNVGVRDEGTPDMVIAGEDTAAVGTVPGMPHWMVSPTG